MSDVNEPLIMKTVKSWPGRYKDWVCHSACANILLYIIRIALMIIVIGCISKAIYEIRNGREPFTFITDLIH